MRSPLHSLDQARRRSLKATAVLALGGLASLALSPVVGRSLWYLSVAALLIATVRAVVRFRRRRPLPWVLVAVGLGLDACAILPVHPIAAMAVRASALTAAVTGLALFADRFDRRPGRRASVETAIVAGAGAMLFWSLIAAPAIAADATTTGWLIAGSAWAMAGTAALGCLATIAMRLTGRSGSLVLLAAGPAGLVITAPSLTMELTTDLVRWAGLTAVAMAPAWSDAALTPTPVIGHAGRPLLAYTPEPGLGHGRPVLLIAAMFTGPAFLLGRPVEGWTEVVLVLATITVGGLATYRLVLHNHDLHEAHAMIEETAARLRSTQAVLRNTRDDRQRLLWQLERWTQADGAEPTRPAPADSTQHVDDRVEIQTGRQPD